MANKMFNYNVRFLQAFSRRLAVHRAAHVELLARQCKRAELKLYPLRQAKLSPVTHAPTIAVPGSGGPANAPAELPLPPGVLSTSSALGVYDKHVPWPLLRSAARDKLVQVRVQYLQAIAARGTETERGVVR